MPGALDTLMSPVILFFILGAFASFARSDLSIPEPFAKAMSLYLMAAIGLKGGVSVASHGFDLSMLAAAVAGIGLSFLLPIPAYAAFRAFGKLDGPNAGALAAHYGSVSVVTFVTATEILGGSGLSPAGYMVAILALMETPAIISGLLLARRGQSQVRAESGELWHEVLLNGSVVLLIGSFLIGLASGPAEFEPIAPLFQTGFTGILCLFLLDMGLIAGRRLRDSRSLTPRLAVLGVLLPLGNGVLGVAVGALIGLDAGSAAALGVLAASASYIAVPAAMRLALPEADAGLSLAMSLGITFPFNIIFGIPVMAAVAGVLC